MHEKQNITSESGFAILKPKVAEFILNVYLNIDKQNISPLE